VTDQISCVALAKLPQIAQWSRALLARNTALVNEFLAATPELMAEPLEVGTVIFPRVEFPVDEFCQLLRERYDTVVTPGKFFGAADHMRIAVGGDPAVFGEAINRVHEAAVEFSYQDRSPQRLT
jgi:aspartate/methionine/tyrosine aminotransferase